MANHPNYGSTSTPPYSYNNYDGDDVRFNQLSDAIGNNILTINSGASTLERILKQIGTSKDKPSLRNNIHATQQKTNVTIFRTTDLIKESASISKTGNKQQKLRTERLQNEFKEAVERYSSLQMQLASKIRSTFSFQSQEANEYGDTEESNLLENKANQMIQQERFIGDLEFQQNLAIEREESVRQLEENILDINQIFRDLGALVHEQGETINTIDANIDRTYHRVEDGRQELYRAASYQKSYRKKICCFAVIVALAAVILTIVLVTTLNK